MTVPTGRRPKAIDLCCGAGGTSVGFHQAGWDIEGIDNEPHPDYPFPLHLNDLLEAYADPIKQAELETFLDGFDLVVGGPPCKARTNLRHQQTRKHPDLLAPTLALLRHRGQPYIIENVDDPTVRRDMHAPILLCGAAYGLGATCRDGVYRHLQRHRLFESNLPLMSAGCACPSGQPGGVYGTGGGGQMTRGYKFHPEEAREAMGIDWMRVEDICQAIPPAYTKYLGEQALDLLVLGTAA
jgi:DNA (cytosine-5)-methyltransferase 1